VLESRIENSETVPQQQTQAEEKEATDNEAAQEEEKGSTEAVVAHQQEPVGDSAEPSKDTTTHEELKSEDVQNSMSNIK
jgi:hypothetical protein